MEPDFVVPRSRRAVLAGAVAGLAAAASTAIGRPEPARASNGDAILLGTTPTDPLDGTGVNQATASTIIYTTAGYGLHAISVGSALRGQSESFVGVEGVSTSSVGVSGQSTSGTGVSGGSSTAHGVRGFTGGTTRPGTAGLSGGSGTGVFGYSDPTASTPPTTPLKTGVYGLAKQDADARGVTGESTLGRGVNGVATTGTGVFGSAGAGEGVHGESTGNNGVSGKSTSGIASGVYGVNTAGGYGVAGTSSSGVGVSANTHTGIAVNALAESGGTAIIAWSIGGTALQVTGRTTFTRSGLTSAGVGKSSVTIGVAGGLAAGSQVLATLESDQAGLAIQRITKNTATGKFKVFLSAPVAAGKTAKIAWFVIG